ncbi:MAG: hypothetical protein GXP32_07010 [Kiritimatiellaeota bacterium]|nr:hypothetical protein [Kiritimatiellota bacterium]
MRYSKELIAGMLVAFALSVFAEDFAIRLTERDKVGDRSEFTQTAEVEESMSITMGGNPIKQDEKSYTAKFAGISKVLKIDKLDRGIEYEIIADTLEKRLKGATKSVAILPKGAKIHVAKKGKKQIYLVDGRPASKDVASLLGIFISLPNSKVTDDDIFGTKERKKVGDTWEINSDLAKKDFSRRGMKIENLTGKTKLEKMFIVNGVKYLVVAANMKTGKFTMPLPPFLKTTRSVISADFSGEVPAIPDTTTTKLKSATNMTISFAAEGKPKPEAPIMRMTVKSTRILHSAGKPLK